MLVHARGDALLDGLADRPVLAVDQIPELAGIARIEIGLGDLERLEQKMADDVGARRAARLQDVGRDVIAGETHEQVGVEELALVPHALVLVEGRKCAPTRRAGGREGIGPGAVRDAARPVEPGAAALAERRHDLAQLRVDAGAVVALVVVLAQRLPVGRHLVADRVTDAQIGQGIARRALRRGAELLREWHRLRGRQVQEHEAAPALHSHRVQAEEPLVESRLAGEVGSCDQAPVEIVGPLVIGAGDATGGDAAGERRRWRRGRGIATQARAAMPAHVVEGAQPARAVAQQQHALAEDIEHAPVARLRELLGARDAQPLATENPFLLRGEHPLGRVPGRGQRRLESRHARRQHARAHAGLASGWSRRQASACGSASSSRA